MLIIINIDVKDNCNKLLPVLSSWIILTKNPMKCMVLVGVLNHLVNLNK